MLTEERFFVDTNATAGTGDGTTRNETSVDGTHAYEDLAAWEADQDANGDLVNRDKVHRVSCQGGQDNDGFTIDAASWTTDSTRYIIIEGDDGVGGTGTYNDDGRYLGGAGSNYFSTSHYYRETAGGDGEMNVDEANCVFRWMQFRLNSSIYSNNDCLDVWGRGDFCVHHCRFFIADAYSNCYCLNGGEGSAEIVVVCCAFSGQRDNGNGADSRYLDTTDYGSATQPITFQDCGFYGCEGDGIGRSEVLSGGTKTFTVRNCIIADIDTYNWQTYGGTTPTWAGDYNALTSGEADFPSGASNCVNLSTTFSDDFESPGTFASATDDLTPADPHTSGVLDNGNDYGNVTFNASYTIDRSVDLTNTTRSSSPVWIGPFDGPAAATGLGVEEIMLHLLRDRINPIRQM